MLVTRNVVSLRATVFRGGYSIGSSVPPLTMRLMARRGRIVPALGNTV